MDNAFHDTGPGPLPPAQAEGAELPRESRAVEHASADLGAAVDALREKVNRHFELLRNRNDQARNDQA